MKKFLAILFGVLIVFTSFAEETLKDNYNVNGIEIVENNEIPTEVITNLMTSKVGDKFSTEKIIGDYNRILKEGYVEELSVFPKLYDGGIKIVVQIKEKKDIKSLLSNKGIIPNSERDRVDTTLMVSNVVIDGIRHLSKDEMSALIPMKTGAYFSEKKIKDGQRALIETGYFRNVDYDILKNSNGVTVVYHVLENPILNGINIIGNTVYTTDELLSVMKTKPGEVFSIRTIQQDRDRIMSKYYDNGYILAEITDIDINNRLELEFILSEGIVRDVQYKKMVTKQKGARRKPTDDTLKTKNFVIEREVEITPGKVFNVNQYDETSRNLMRTGHFKNIKYDANTIPGDPDGRSLVLLIDEERTASLQGAVSYGSEVGLLGMLSVKDTNWAGRGQNLGVSFEKSDEDYSNLSIDFFDPWIKDTDRLSWGWNLYKSTSQISDSTLFNEVETVGGKVTIGKGISKFTRLSLGTKLEHIVEKNVDGSTTDKYQLWSLFPSITYDTRNNYLNATSGEYARLQLEGGYANGNNADYFGNVTLELRKFHRGLFKNNTMAYRLNSGIMTDTTKESQRFWVGGSSLRGYEGGFFQGTIKLVGTIENRTQFTDVIGLVFFIDAGRAWEQKGRDPGYSHDAQFPDQIATAAGVGLRLNTPIGPLRFDFGWPVGDKIGGASGMQFYFNMGHSF